MKALQINSYGGQEVMEFNESAPKPLLKPGQILIEVSAASLNRIDTVIRAGYMKDMLPLQFPATMGGDFAGTISELAEGTTNFKIGDKVYGQAGLLLGGSGSLAEYAVVENNKIAKSPTSIDMVQVASLPLVGSSVIQGLEEHIGIEAGQKILIHGGAGGIGSLAIQLAKVHGAYVASTAGTDELDFVKSLGADEVIDYKTQDFTTLLKDFDAVFVTANEALNPSIKILKKGGKLVSMVGPADEALAKEHDITVIAQMTQASTEQLTRLAELIDSGKIKPQIDKTFSFDQAKEAFKYFEEQHPKGKVIVTLK